MLTFTFIRTKLPATSRVFFRVSLVLGIALACSAPPLALALSFVNSRSGLNSTDFIDWATAGPEYTELSNPFNITSDLGHQFSISKKIGGTFFTLEEGSGWNGGFRPGDTILDSLPTVLGPGETVDERFTTINPISISGPEGLEVYSFGTQILAGFFGSFTARIEAFDSNNSSLGYYDVEGFSDSYDSDGSAPFLGVQSEAPISRIAFSLVNAPDGTVGDFAINKVDFSTTSPTSGTPAPGPLPLLGVPAAFIYSRRLRRRINRGKALPVIAGRDPLLASGLGGGPMDTETPGFSVNA